jgi:hypothetical protein
MTALTNPLTRVLKTDYPQALNWAGDRSCEPACAFLEQWPTLADLQKSRRFRIREFYEKSGRPPREIRDERVTPMEKARPLTVDPAVVLACTMMVNAVVAQIRPLRAAIEKYDVEIERTVRQHPDRAVFESFPGAGKVLAPRLRAILPTDGRTVIAAC